MVKNGIFAIEFDGFSEFLTGFFIVLEFVINDAKSVVNGREPGVLFEELIKAIKGSFIVRLPLVVKAQIIKAINIFRLKFQCHQVVSFLLIIHVEFLITHRPVII